MRRRTQSLVVVLVIFTLGAIVGAGWLLLVSRPATPSPACGGPAELVNPQRSSSSGGYQYQIQMAGGGGGVDTWSEFAFSIQDSNGTAIPTSAAGWSLSIRNNSGDVLASYDLRAPSPTWSFGGATMLSTTQYILLTSPPAYSLTGDTFTLLGTGSPCAGGTSINLP